MTVTMILGVSIIPLIAVMMIILFIISTSSISI